MSGLIQGADKWICLSPIPKVFLSVICTTEAWEKKKRVWKVSLKSPCRKQRENSGDTVFRGRLTLGRQTEGLVTGTSLPSCSSNRPSSPLLSWEAPGLPKDSLSHCPPPAAAHRGQRQRGHWQFSERWQQEMNQSLRLAPSLGGR